MGVAEDSLPWSDHHSRRSCLETAESKLTFQVLDVNDGSFLCGRCRRLAVLHSRRQGTTGCSSVVTAFRKENKLYAEKKKKKKKKKTLWGKKKKKKKKKK